MLVFYIFLSVCVSFLCSLLEAVILSLTPSYIASLKTVKPKLYKRADKLKSDLERPLASILTFNTIAHTVGAAGAGAEAQRIFGSDVLALFSAVLTFVILFFSEIIPKSIGATYWKKLLPWAITVLRPMNMIAYPIVSLAQFVSKLFKKEDTTFTREEISAMAEVGHQEGVIATPEFDKIDSILKFNNVSLKSILTPTEKVSWVLSERKIKDIYFDIQKNTHSRLIVFGADEKTVEGYILRVKVYDAFIKSPDSIVDELVYPILLAKEDSKLYPLMSKLMSRKEHIAAVVDKNNNFLGVVTLEDILEHMLGLEIFDELDQDE